MKMPGFTAEASLFNGDMRYQATTVAAVYGGFVQPALFRDRVDNIYIGFCIKPPSCFRDPLDGTLHCLPLSVGFWNPITGACE